MGYLVRTDDEGLSYSIFVFDVPFEILIQGHNKTIEMSVKAGDFSCLNGI